VTVLADSPGSGVTRLSLLSRARRRDSRAWEELVELYQPLVLTWCRRRGVRTDAAADCCQEVFRSVAASLDRFEPTKQSGSFRGWLWTITANRLTDMARQAQRQPAAAGGSSALRAMQGVTEWVEEDEPTEAQQIHELVERARTQIRDEFAERTWNIFDRSVIDGVSTTQVAEEFQVSPATVRQTRSRILKRLRQQLGDLADD